MRFHLVGLPHTHTTEAFSACAFTEKVRKFAIMMMNRGHEVYLYGGAENEAPCTEHIVCITEEERLAHVGGRHFIEASFNASDPGWVLFNGRVVHEIRKRAQQTDFICVIGGLANKPIADALPHMMTVEFGIGYGGTFAKYRVWESYAWMHTCYGAAAGNPVAADGLPFDEVIPGYFEPEKFPFKADIYERSAKDVDQGGSVTGPTGRHGPLGYYALGSEEEAAEAKAKHLATCNQCRLEEGYPPVGFEYGEEPYFFFIGRLITRKGYDVAAETCRRIGAKLIIAGQVQDPLPNDCDYVGVVGPKERGKLMAGARAVFVPTQYIEPFGNVAVEAQACGTSVISTDWGAMTETVEEGKTGFRCRSLQEFIDATRKVDNLDPQYIRDRVMRLYSLPVIAEQYERYFERLQTLWGDGWYAVA